MRNDVTLSDVVRRVYKDLTPLNVTAYNVSPQIDPVVFNDLTPTNLNYTNLSYYVNNLNQPMAKLTLSWTAPVVDTDNLVDDDPVDYLLGYSTNPTDSVDYRSTRGQTSIVVTDLPLNTSLYFQVVTVGTSGRRSAPLVLNVNIGSYSTTVATPSTPILASGLKGVNIKWNGKTSTNTDYSNLKYIEVYADNATITTISGVSPSLIIENPNIEYYLPFNYGPVYVRFTAVDVFGNRSALSTEANTTISKLVNSDMGVVMPGDIAFRDTGNLIPDGSFESSVFRQSRIDSAQIVGTKPIFGSASGYAAHGSYYLYTSSAGYMYLVGNGDGSAGDIPVYGGQKFYASAKIRGDTGTDGSARLSFRWKDAAGTTSFSTAFSTTTPTGAYVFFEGVVTAPASAVSCNVSIGSDNQTTGIWRFDAVQVRHIVGTEIIEDLAVTNAKIGDLAVTTQKVEEVSAGKISTGTLLATTSIYAGSSTSYHAKLSSSGFSASVPDGDGGVTETIRVGTSSDNILSVAKNGVIVSTIDENGNGSFNNLSFDSALFNGSDLDAILDGIPKGMIHESILNNQTYSSSGWGNYFFNVSKWLVAGRTYEFWAGGGGLTTNSASTNAVLAVEVHYSTTNYGTIASLPWRAPTNYITGIPFIVGRFTPSTTGTHTFKVRVNCSIDFTVTCSAEAPFKFVLRDMGIGANVTNTYAYIATGGSETVVNSYVSVWNCSAITNYNGSGGVISGNTEAVQGYYSSTNGNRYARLLFNGNAVSGEAVPIATALTGATIDKVELYLYYFHWYYNNGGTAVVRANTSTTASGGTNSAAREFASWPRNYGKYVDISSIFGNTHRSIQLGPGPSQALTYYGKAHGIGSGSTLPKLRITYRR